MKYESFFVLYEVSYRVVKIVGHKIRKGRDIPLNRRRIEKERNILSLLFF